MRASRWAMIGLVVLGCGPRTYSVRLKHAERLGDTILRELDEAQRAEEALEPDRAAEALAEARKHLDEPDAPLYPEAALLAARYQELAEALPGARGERERKQLEQRLDALRDTVVPSALRAQEALEQLPAEAPTDGQLEAVEAPAREVVRRLDDSGPLFARAPDFAAWARSQRGKAEKALAQAAVARARRAFLQGPARDLEEATALARSARREKDLARRQELLQGVVERSRRCAEGATAAARAGALGAAPLQVKGKPRSVAQVARACAAARRDAASELVRTTQAIARSKVVASARGVKSRR